LEINNSHVLTGYEMFFDNKHNVILRSVLDSTDHIELIKKICTELKLDEIQSTYILNNLPILLYQDINDEEIELVKPRLDTLMQSGVNYEITQDKVENINLMKWNIDKPINDKNQNDKKENKSANEVNTVEEVITIDCPCASCGSVLRIRKTTQCIEVKSITSATKNPLYKSTGNYPVKEYSDNDIENIKKAVANNVYGGIETIQDLPTKPEFNINFTDYGFNSVREFTQYQYSLMANKTLDSWSGGN
jgi:hypothetical protein